MNNLQNVFLIVLVIILVGYFNSKKEQFIEQEFPDFGLVFPYAHIYAMRNSGNLDEARAKMDKLFIKLRFPIDDIRKANANYIKYEKYFTERMG